MTYSSIAELRNRSPYSGTGSLTREQFLFFEMRTTAKLMTEGLSDEEIHQRIYEDNLFQFPTEKSIKLITSGCIRRLKSLNNPGKYEDAQLKLFNKLKPNSYYRAFNII